MVFYFTSTGNSLYATRQLGDDLCSIAQELHREVRYRKSHVTLADLVRANSRA